MIETKMKTLADYTQIIEESIKAIVYPSEPKNLYEPVSYMMELGGKRLRPAAVLMAHNLFNNQVEKAIPAALAVEVFHNFTLVHDDIMDKADIRRGRETVHTKWDNNRAILSGDAMMILAYDQLSKLEPAALPAVFSVFNKTALEVCDGQQYDMDFETREEVTVAEYLKMIRLKTSVLLACSLQMGAITGGANPEQQEILYNIGENLGLGFQLQDDYLDAFSDESLFGKKTGGDIVQNKKTYMLISALTQANDTTKESLLTWMEKTGFSRSEKVNAIKDIYQIIGVDKEALQLAESYFAKAKEGIEKLDVAEERKQTLREFLEVVGKRKK
ncbi:MAG: polyprenyl synthetase family protein [Bacteroidales bacterium]|nr:polyprenyl synthetase family protein [Bacteroidales bacterium]